MMQSWRILWEEVEHVKGPLGSGAPSSTKGIGDRILGSVSSCCSHPDAASMICFFTF